MNFKRSLMSFCIVLFASTLLASGPEGTTISLTQTESDILAKTNEVRARHDLAPLAMSPRLMESARRHTSWMASAGSLTHTGDQVGENIAWGQTDAADAIDSWMNSPGHRANMLSAEYTEIGVAAYVVEGGRIYWCQQFLR